MSPTPEELLRDALRTDAGTADSAGDFDAVRDRAHTLVRRQRWQRQGLVAGGAVAVCAVVAIGVVAAIGDDDGRSDVQLSPPETTATTAPVTTSSAPPATIPTTAPEVVEQPVITGTLPPAEGFAGASEYRSLDPDALGATFHAPAASPQLKVDAMVAAFASEDVEGRRDVEGVVNSVTGDRALIEVRVVGVADDSVGAVDYRIQLRLVDGAWTLEGAEARDWCTRGFDGTFCV